MSILREQPNGVKDIEFNSGDKLIYNGDDIEGVLRNRRILHVVLKLVARLNQSLDDKLEISEGNVSVISEPGLNVRKSKKRETFYYKVFIDGKQYFLKRLSATMGKEYGGGYEEFKGADEARSLLSNMEGVEVVNYKLGCEYNGMWYFVSEWNPALEVTLEDFLKNLQKQGAGISEDAGKAHVKHNSIMLRAKNIERILRPKFEDVFTYNMAYDIATDKVIIFDLNKKKEETTRVD